MKKNLLIAILFILPAASGYFCSLLYAESSQMKAVKALESQQLREQEAIISRPKVAYKASALRDPFIGIIIQENVKKENPVSEASLPDFTIQGIIWGGRVPQAIINNKVMGVGDTVQGARIIDIGKEGITVLYGGRSFTLKSPIEGGVSQ